MRKNYLNLSEIDMEEECVAFNLPSGRLWTHDDDRSLRKLFEQHTPIYEIAKQIKRSRYSVISHLHVLGLRHSHIWTEEERQTIRSAYAEGLTYKEIVARLGFSTIKCVESIVAQMGIANRLKTRCWTQSELCYLRESHANGTTILEIARTLGRTYDSVRIKATSNGFLKK